LFPWIEANGYHSVDEPREIYLQTKGDGNQNDPDCVTEVQVPVERA
jgi:effector-binding domain-containing protein